jgi:hypothetical protein
MTFCLGVSAFPAGHRVAHSVGTLQHVILSTEHIDDLVPEGTLHWTMALLVLRWFTRYDFAIPPSRCSIHLGQVDCT